MEVQVDVQRRLSGEKNFDTNGDHQVPEPRETAMSPAAEENPPAHPIVTPSSLNSQKLNHALLEQLLTWKEDAETMTFLQDLFDFMEKRGTPIRRIPTVNKSALNLCTFYNAVISRGGLVNVIAKKLWRQVTAELDVPASCTSAAYTLRTHYTKYLYAYECVKKGFSKLEELQKVLETTFRPRPSDTSIETSPAPAVAKISSTAEKDSTKSSVHTPKPLRLSNSADSFNWSRGQSFEQTPFTSLVNQWTSSASKEDLTQTSVGTQATLASPNGENTRSISVGTDPFKTEKVSFDHSPMSPFSRPPLAPTSDILSPSLWNMAIPYGYMNGSFMEAPLDLSTSPPLKDSENTSEKEQGTQTAHQVFESKAAGGIHMRIVSRGNTAEGSGSVIVKMDLNGIVYEGVLFAQMETNSPPRAS